MPLLRPRMGALRSGMTQEEVRALVRLHMQQHATRKGSTGFRAWCIAHGVAVAHASQWMRGEQKTPPSDVLDALGLEVSYVFKRR